VKDINDVFTFCPGRVQAFQIRREGNISRCAGGIDQQLASVSRFIAG
jgi:hypothetical protein